MVLAYVQAMYNRMINTDSTYSTGGREVSIHKYKARNETYYEVYHYGTLIVTLHPEMDTARLGGGFSATDQRIINDFFKCFGISEHCRRSQNRLWLE